MIQKGCYLKVIDNSGARLVYCINIISTTNTKRYALIGDLLLVSIKKLRVRRRYAAKIKKGALARALLVRSKLYNTFYYGDKLKFYDKAVVLLHLKNYNLIGTRVFGLLPKYFRFTHYLRILSLCSGIRN